ncbi:MAG: hypothetical protein JJ871_00095 [Thalassospira sp.]|uniref:tectonin domain-containing protein n=1 Tax=Thalassospira sp. TaxID=1912094 RepID=UPI001B2AAC72|nr:tectonin domain-containing protein [Thalassospira sp.]MBO6579643.1 hypothetical protein [Thalassospira sp.]MBO6819870.1 hypothetical protein [Thalassospira sp.]MBO6886434.1 hypothetical protein [Thalassospira sp.]
MGTRFRSEQTVWQTLLILTVFTIGVLANASDAKAQQTQAAFSEPGHALCGALDLRTNTLLAPCEFSKATKTGKAVGECPRGSFFDIGTWSCFSCPAGYNRTGFAVDTQMACSKTVSAQYKSATRVGAHKSCPSGSFHDPRNGGECWSCPTGFGRTWSPVDAWDACGKFGASARRAEFIDRVCPEGTITDPNGSCYTCPDGFRRTAAAVTANNACFRNESLVPAEKTAALTCKAGEIFDFVDGGTCWTCPEASVRSIFGIKSNEACEYTTMRWESAKRTPNGLFGLPGGHEIAAEVIAERKRVDAASEKFITESKMNKSDAEAYRTAVWKQIHDAPETSPELKGAVYDYIFDVIQRGAKTKPERDMVSYITAYVQDTRKLSASEMKLVMESWQKGLQAKKASRPTVSTNVYDTGVAPPDLRSAISSIMHIGPAAGLGLLYIGGSAAEALSPAFQQMAGRIALQILPYRAKEIFQGVTISSSGFAGAAIGPLVILSVSSVLASIATDIALEQNKQEAIVNDALAVAQRPINLARLLKTDDGRNEVATNWALMTQEPIKPKTALWARLMPSKTSTNTVPKVVLEGEKVVVGAPDIPVIPMAQIDAIVTTTTAAANGTNAWESVSGKATDIAIGTDGTAYAISPTKANRSGYQIFKRESKANSWTKLPGAGYRIAVSDTTAWVINLRGQIYSLSGSNWQIVRGPQAQDIGASAKGVWIIDVNGKIHTREGNGWKNIPGTGYRIDIDQDGRPWVVDKNGDMWVHGNDQKWQKLPGQGIDIAIDVPGQARAIDKLGNTFVFDGAKRNWVATSREKDALAIGAGGGQVWRVTKNNQIYRMK